MRSAWCSVAVLSLALVGAAASVRAAPAGGELRAAALRCEYRDSPLGIEETQPRLSWQLQGSGRDRRQAAYQVLVATSPDRLRDGAADLWDSGRVQSDQSQQVVYAGKPLRSGLRAYWKVRAWDERGRRGSYSRPAWWQMGLLSPSDWTAKWIGLPVERQQTRLSLEGSKWVWYPEGNPRQGAPIGIRYFRRVLSLPADRKPTRAVFLLAADNNYTLQVNGKQVASGGGWQGAAQADVLPALVAGQNVLAVTAENVGEQANPAGLVGRLFVTFDSGEPLRLDIDSSWKVNNQSAPGWERAGFADASWKTPMVVASMGEGPWGQTSVADTTPSPSPFLRKRFQAERPAEARLYVAALGLFQAQLNGKPVGDDVLAPGWTDYRKRVQYRTYDVTSLVRGGSNTLGVVLGDGWYAGSLGFDLRRNHFGPNPARARAQLDLRYPDGKVTRIVSDDSWQGAFGPIRSSDLYAGETYDARLEMAGWSEGGTAGEWRGVTVYTDQNPAVNAQVDPPIRVTEELKTQQITEPRPGVYVFDLGQNMVGHARLRVRGGKAGDTVTLRFAEVLNPDGTVYRDNLRMAKATDTYILSGAGEETWAPHFTYHGFRYVEVTGYPGKPALDAITGRVFHSDMEPTSRFETSSTLVNRLYRNVWWGQRANLMSVPTDCPQRDERLGWMGDAQLFARTSCWYMDMAPFYTKWMRDIVDAQSPQGAFSDVSPRAVDMADGAPAWAEAGVVIPWTVYRVYGDRRILERNYDSIRKYVDLLHSANPDHLWLKRRNNDFGDWVPAGERTNKDLIASAYLAYDTRLLSKMAEALGKTEDARRYAALADVTRDAFNGRFLGPDGRYTGDTQTAYAMAIAFDLVPAARRAQVADRLRESVARRGFTLGTGFIGTALLLPALSETGQSDIAYRLLTNTRYPSWGYMIEKGATTIWELWNSDTEGPGMNSRNHFAFGSVAEWMQRYLGGIDLDPSVPGYRKFLIRPQVGGPLSFARAEYDSHYGTIRSGWTRSGSGYTVRVSVPVNTTARVVLPRGAASTEGLRAADDAGSAAFEVGSGEYTFTVGR